MIATTKKQVEVFPQKAAAPYARCNSSEEFRSPFVEDEMDISSSSSSSSPTEINRVLLNLNLGQGWITSDSITVHRIVAFIHLMFLSWWEDDVMAWIEGVSNHYLRPLMMIGWRVFLYLHGKLIGSITGLHPSVSTECHALSTVMFLCHFTTFSIPRIRLGLSSFGATQPTPPKSQIEHVHDGGLFLHYNHNADMSTYRPTETSILWIYGGAFLSGCPKGNVGIADELAQQCEMDVYVPDYRKAPQHTMADIVEDVVQAYRWLWERRLEQGLDPSQIVVAGWSAGAALCIRLMQMLKGRGVTACIEQLLRGLSLPNAAVLFSPFVRYEEEMRPGSSMEQYSLHDWLVTRGVINVGKDTLHLDFWGGDEKFHSPLSYSMEGLPPLCVIVSEHEAVYDEACDFIQAARGEQVPVTVGLWRFMSHGWYMFHGLIPEGAHAVNFVSEWIQSTMTANLPATKARVKVVIPWTPHRVFGGQFVDSTQRAAE